MVKLMIKTVAGIKREIKKQKAITALEFKQWDCYEQTGHSFKFVGTTAEAGACGLGIDTLNVYKCEHCGKAHKVNFLADVYEVGHKVIPDFSTHITQVTKKVGK